MQGLGAVVRSDLQIKSYIMVVRALVKAEPKKKVKVKIFKFTLTLKILLKKNLILSLPPTVPHAPQPTQKDKTNLKTCCYSNSEDRASGNVTVGSEKNRHRNSLVADFRT